MNDINFGDIIVCMHGDSIIDEIIAEGAHIVHPNFPYGKIPSHVTSPIFQIDEDFIHVCLNKFANSDPEYPDSREWIKEHLYGKPVSGDRGIEEMVANGLCGGKLEDSGYLTDNNIFILEPRTPWTQMGLKALSVWGSYYFKKQVPYDYLVYLAYAEEIGVGWCIERMFHLPQEWSPWLGPTVDPKGIKDVSQNKQVCVELGERFTNWACLSEQAINPDYNNGKLPFPGNVNESQPIDILLNDFWQIKKTSPNQLKNF
jgi:hypothetical protein